MYEFRVNVFRGCMTAAIIRRMASGTSVAYNTLDEVTEAAAKFLAEVAAVTYYTPRVTYGMWAILRQTEEGSGGGLWDAACCGTLHRGLDYTASRLKEECDG